MRRHAAAWAAVTSAARGATRASSDAGTPMSTAIDSPAHATPGAITAPSLGATIATVTSARTHAPRGCPVSASRPLGTSIAIRRAALVLIASITAARCPVTARVTPMPSTASTTIAAAAVAARSASSPSPSSTSITAPPERTYAPSCTAASPVTVARATAAYAVASTPAARSTRATT